MKFKSNAKYNEPVESGTIYEGKIGHIHISVHRVIHCDGWYLSCPDVWMSQNKLKSETLMEAINESKDVLKKVVEELMDDVNSFCEQEVEVSRY